MKNISNVDRILLLLTSLFAGYQVVIGIEGKGSPAIAIYTIGFGVLLIASLLLLFMGFDILISPYIVIISTIIPLSLSVAMLSDFFPKMFGAYLIFSIVGFLMLVITRVISADRIGTIILIILHGVSGLIIFFLPIFLTFNGITPIGFLFVSIGGGLIGLGGILLSLNKAGRSILSVRTIYRMFPIILFSMTLFIVIGFSAV